MRHWPGREVTLIKISSLLRHFGPLRSRRLGADGSSGGPDWQFVFAVVVDLTAAVTFQIFYLLMPLTPWVALENYLRLSRCLPVSSLM